MLSLALDDRYVYFGGKGGPVRRVPKAGGEVFTYAPGSLVWARMTVDESDIYYAGREALMRMPKDGSGAPVAVVPSQPQWGPLSAAFGLAIDGGSLYWTTQGGGVARMPKEGGEPQLMATLRDCEVRGLSVDDRRIYATARCYENGGPDRMVVFER